MHHKQQLVPGENTDDFISHETIHSFDERDADQKDVMHFQEGIQP